MVANFQSAKSFADSLSYSSFIILSVFSTFSVSTWLSFPYSGNLAISK